MCYQGEGIASRSLIAVDYGTYIVFRVAIITIIVNVASSTIMRTATIKNLESSYNISRSLIIYTVYEFMHLTNSVSIPVYSLLIVG